MFLFINNPWLMENRETAFYKGDKLNRILELNPRLRAMESNDIEEIILYSGRKDNDENMCISCKCNGFTMQSGQLNLSVCQKEPQDISSGYIRKALYAYWKQTGQLKDNEFMPDITLVEDYPTYTRIKISQSRSVAMDRSWMGNVEEYKKKNEWNNIIAMIPDWDTIETHEVWESDEGLGELAFALSQINHWLYGKKKDPESRKQHEHNAERFIKLINRALEINPDNIRVLSAKAYFYYDRYRAFNQTEDYVKGTEIYEVLNDRSYVDHYRHIRLQQRYADWFWISRGKRNDDIQPVAWEQIVQSFEALIERYNKLSEDERKRQKIKHIRCLYHCASTIIENALPGWDEYFSTIYYQRRISYTLSASEKAEECLKSAIQLTPCGITREAADAKPREIDIHYRLSQLYLSLGIAHLLEGQIPNANIYFEKSVQEANTALKLGKEFKEKGIPTGFYLYVRTPLAQSLFLSGHHDDAYHSLQPQEGWQWVDQAQMYLLDRNLEQAKECLKHVGEKDTSKSKAEALLQSIGENETC